MRSWGASNTGCSASENLAALPCYVRKGRLFRGGLKYAARWHEKGIGIVYTAQSLSLAALEFFVNLETDDLPLPLVAISAEIPESMPILSVEIKDLPSDWRTYPASPSVQRIGTHWVEAGRPAVLSVP